MPATKHVKDLVTVTMLGNHVLVHRDPNLIRQQALAEKVFFSAVAVFACTIGYVFFHDYPNWWPRIICFGMAFILIYIAFCQKKRLPNPFLIPINPSDIDSIIISVDDEGYIRIYIRNTKKKLQPLFHESLQLELSDLERYQLGVKLGQILGKPVYIRHNTILGWIERLLTEIGQEIRNGDKRFPSCPG